MNRNNLKTIKRFRTSRITKFSLFNPERFPNRTHIFNPHSIRKHPPPEYSTFHKSQKKHIQKKKPCKVVLTTSVFNRTMNIRGQWHRNPRTWPPKSLKHTHTHSKTHTQNYSKPTRRTSFEQAVNITGQLMVNACWPPN